MLEWQDQRVANSAGAMDPAFRRVAETFAANFVGGEEQGACFAAYIDGELCVSLRGGSLDRKGEIPWTDETIACVYSSGKAVVSLLAARAVSDGAIDYDAPISTYWPAFAANGKAAITVADALSHQDGLCAIAEEMGPQEWLDWDAICTRLEAMAPLWPPGSASGYHPQTFGFIIGEVLRRTVGVSVGRQIAALAETHDLSIYCGMSETEQRRASPMRKPPRAPILGDITELKKLAFLSPWSAAGRASPQEWMAAEIPASNIHADARSLAAIVYPLASGGVDIAGDRYVATDVVAEALRERLRGDDLVLPFELSWAAGLMRNINGHFGPSASALGHAGFGGSCVIIDPEKKLSAAYVMNRMSPHLVGDPRAIGLIDALYASL